jgi:hypothetical protein
MRANNVLRNSYKTRPLLCARITCCVTVFFTTVTLMPQNFPKKIALFSLVEQFLWVDKFEETVEFEAFWGMWKYRACKTNYWKCLWILAMSKITKFFEVVIGTKKIKKSSLQIILKAIKSMSKLIGAWKVFNLASQCGCSFSSKLI